MAVHVFVHDDAVDVDFTGWDRIWALKGHLRLQMSDIVDARIARQDELKRDLGWRLGGTCWPGSVAAGRYSFKGREGARQLWSCYRDPEVLLIETSLDDPCRVVLQHPDRHQLAWLIAERIPR